MIKTPSSLSFKRLEFYSFLIASLLGVLFHFVYDWSGQNFWAGLFFPVNESTWEHLKLVFFPILLVSMIEYFLTEPTKCFACNKLKSALLGMLSVVILFYTYTGILGRNYDWLNITIYVISMAIAYLYSYNKISTGNADCKPASCIIGATIVILLFMIFTVYPPELGLFRQP